MSVVYVVDDNPTHAKLAAKAVRTVSSEVHVEIFHDPFKAMMKAMDTPPDLMIVDFMMPKMDGITLLRELSKSGIVTKTIITSAFIEKVSKTLLPTNNVQAVLGKPYSMSDLVAVVADAIYPKLQHA